MRITRTMKMKLVASASVVSIAIGAPTFAQTSDAGAAEPTQNCRADSGSDFDNGGVNESLAEQLDRCNGVIKPPKIGDREMVEPAPQVGTMPIITPGDLPDQTTGVDKSGENSRAEKAIDAGSGIDQIVDLIAHSSNVAEQLEAADNDLQLNLINISVVFQGEKSAILRTALRQHENDVDELRSALAKNKFLAQELESEGVILRFVVAAEFNEDGSINVFVR